MRYAFLGPLETCHLNAEGKFSSGSLLLPYFFLINFFLGGGLQKNQCLTFYWTQKEMETVFLFRHVVFRRMCQFREFYLEQCP